MAGGYASVYALASRHDTLFAGTAEGLFRSTDGGDHWRRMGGKEWLPRLLLTGGLIFTSLNNAGVAVSADDGATWSPRVNGMAGSGVQALAMCGSRLFAGAQRYCSGRFCESALGALYVSTDLGANWSVAGFQGTDVLCLLVRDSMLYVGAGARVCATSNGGMTWDTLGTFGTSVRKMVASSSHLYIVDGDNKVYRRPILGGNWTLASEFPQYPYSYISAMAVCRDSLYIGLDAWFGSFPEEGLYVSADSGVHWRRVDTGIAIPLFGAVLGTDSLLFAGTRTRGVFLSRDWGEQWEWRSDGMTRIRETRAFAGDDGDRLYCVTVDDGLFRTSDMGQTWHPMSSSPTMVRSLAVSGAHLLAGSATGLAVSHDTGSSWTPITFPPTSPGDLSSVALGVFDNVFYAAANGALQVSTDFGDTWTVRSQFGASGAPLWRLVRRGGVFYGARDHVFRSTDLGVTWTGIDGGIDPTYGFNTTGLAQNDSAVLLAEWGVGMYRLAADRAGWDAVSDGLPTLSTSCVATSGQYAFAGTGGRGVSMSTNNGSHWFSINAGFSDSGIQCLAANQGFLFAGTSNGLFVRPISELTGVGERDRELPGTYVLSQNYPNPFNPTTRIDFELPIGAYTTLEVYDVLGRTVASLVADLLPAGRHSTVWNATGRASGVYFYMLRSGRHASTGKLVLQR